MSRNMSLTARRAMNAPETDQVFLALLTIVHPELPEPIRVVNDFRPKDEQGVRKIVSRGEDFICYPFEAALPADHEDQLSRVRLRIDNVDREITASLRSISSAPRVVLEVVLASDPDTVEAGPFEFELVTASFDALVVEGELGFEPILNEPFPADSFTPNLFPGLFR